MDIRVMYADGRFDMVRNNMLDTLVAKRGIRAFNRSSGWVNIDRDTRCHKRMNFIAGGEIGPKKSRKG